MTKLTEICERAVNLAGSPANSLVNFSGHDVALIGVHRGKRVEGVAFNSIGRVARSGILRDRMIPRLLAAPADTLLNDSGRLDPAAVSACALRDEKRAATGPPRPRRWNWRAGT
ncbi:hypothetical protein ACX9NE_08580 [Mycobacterium sp. ML4]